MPLIPELALQGRVPQVSVPDFPRLLGLAAELQDAQQQRRIRDLAYTQALEERQTQREMSAYLRGEDGMQPLARVGQPPRLADAVPQAPFGTYVQAPSLMSQLSPGTQAPPGTTYTRAPAAMPPRGGVAPPTSGPRQVTGQELVQRFGLAGLPVARQLDELEAVQNQRQQRDVAGLAQGMEVIRFLAGSVGDQASLDALRARVGAVPALKPLADVLPQTYSPDAMENVTTTMADRIKFYGETRKARADMIRAQADLRRAEAEGRRADADKLRTDIDQMRVDLEGRRTEVDEQRQRLEREKFEQEPARKREELTRPVVQDYLKQSNERARGAQTMLTTLNEVEALLDEGVYPQSPTLAAALEIYQRTGQVPPGYDEQQLARTGRLRELGAGMILAATPTGNLGAQISNTDRDVYARAGGNFERGRSDASMRESLVSLRRIASGALERANRDAEEVERTGRVPRFETPAAPPRRAVAETRKQGKSTRITEADVQATMQASGRPRDAVIKAFRDQGYELGSLR